MFCPISLNYILISFLSSIVFILINSNISHRNLKLKITGAFFQSWVSALESSLHNLDEIEKDIAQKSLPAPTPNVLYGVHKNFK